MPRLLNRRIGCVSLQSRIANDLDTGVNATLTPSAQQLISLKSLGQTPDYFLRRLLRTILSRIVTNPSMGVKRVLAKL